MKKKLLGIPFGLVGAGIGLGIIGEGIGSESVAEAGGVATGFIAPAVNIGAGAFVIDMVRDIDKNRK